MCFHPPADCAQMELLFEWELFNVFAVFIAQKINNTIENAAKIAWIRQMCLFAYFAQFFFLWCSVNVKIRWYNKNIIDNLVIIK